MGSSSLALPKDDSRTWGGDVYLPDEDLRRPPIGCSIPYRGFDLGGDGKLPLFVEGMSNSSGSSLNYFWLANLAKPSGVSFGGIMSTLLSLFY